MKRTDLLGIAIRKKSTKSPLLGPLAGYLVCGLASAVGQSVVAPPPPAPEVREGGPGATGEVLKAPSTAPWEWGAVAFRPHALYRLSYGDGVQSRPGQSTTTTINMFSPGMLAELGTHWTADYTPTWTFYSNRAFGDSVAHNASVRGIVGFTDGDAQFSQTYSLSRDPLIETGRQTRQESAGTSLAVNYSLGRQTRLEATAAHNLRYLENAPNSREWTTTDWLHYQFSNRLDVAVGAGLGKVNVEPETDLDMKYSQAQARIGWKPVDKLSLDIHGGREHRTFSKAGSAALNSPTYGGSIQYQPVEVTTISLGAERGVTPSFFANQVTDSSSWTISLDQRLLQRFHLTAGYGRHKSRYISPAAVIVVGRDDESSTFHLRLGTSFLRRGNIALFYQRTKNSSNIAGYGFASDQSGIEIGYRY